MDDKITEEYIEWLQNLFNSRENQVELTPGNKRPAPSPPMNPTYGCSFKEKCDKKLNELGLRFTYESDERIFMNYRDKEIADTIVVLMRETEFLKYTKKGAIK